MSRSPAIALVFVFASCSPDAPAPPPARPMVEVVPPQEAPAPPAPTPAPAPPPPPAVKPAPAKDESDFKVAVAIPLEPQRSPPEDPSDRQIHLPAFTLRTMNHAQVEVQVNGARLSTTPCLWSVCDTMEFDPEIKVPDWPPAGAKFAGTTKRLVDNKAGLAEIYIAAGDEIQPRIPHLRPGEHVLYVRGTAGRKHLFGALRLMVGKPGQPYRFVDYAAVMDTESDNSSRFQRTLWFENRE